MKKTLSCLLLAVMLVTMVGMVPVSAKSKIKLNKKKITLELKESFKLKLKGVKSTEVQWQTGSINVALVTKKGKVTAVGEGKTKIYATYNGKTYKCTVTVTAKVQAGGSHTIGAEEYDKLYREAFEIPDDKPCPITLPGEAGWYVASYSTGKEQRHYWLNSRESYSGEAMTWVTTMECWVTEFVLDYEYMSECISLLDSQDAKNYEFVFAYWKDTLFAKLRTASYNFDDSAEYLADSAKYIGDTAKGYPIIQYLCEYDGHIATVYITYNIEKCVLQGFVLVNGEGSRMKPEIEKYLEEAIINQ